MPDTSITSLPGYPYLYVMPISSFIRHGPERRSKQFSKSRLQDRNSLPPPYTPPAWSPYILEAFAELDGLNEIPQQIYPYHQRPYENETFKRPQTTPPDIPVSQRRKSRVLSLKTQYSWKWCKPQVSSPLSSSSNGDKSKDLFTIEEQEPERGCPGKVQRGAVEEMERREEMGDEERVQVALIESIFAILHDLQPTYLPQ